MLESKGMQRANAMAARAPREYAQLKATAEQCVVRWQWASNSIHSYEPADFEIHKFTRGKLLRSEPNPPTNGMVQYGYDAEGRVVVERQYTEFPGQMYETFYLHERDGIMRFYYNYSIPDKEWVAVEWFAICDGRVVASDSVSSFGPTQSKTYQYDNHGRMVRCELHATNPLHHDWRELEYDDEGKIVRIYWCFPDGKRILDFERPTRQANLKSRKRDLLQGLTAAIVDAIGRSGVTDEVYALVLRYDNAYFHHMLPPLVGLNTVSERARLVQLHGDDHYDVIWNPSEWQPWGELNLKLSPELEALCEKVNQDIWQNERYEEVASFLAHLAQALNKTQLPVRRADEFVSVVVAMEQGDFATQVDQQITSQIRKKLRRGGWLRG